MPENIRDLRVTMLYTGEKLDKKMIKKADKKIAQATEMFKNGVYTRSGLTPLNYIVGMVLNWLPFYPKTDKYITAPKVNAAKCDGCVNCVKLCPMGNISIAEKRVSSGNKCTVCYRRCKRCPAQALTVLGKQVYGQYNFSK
jgi:Pyruvate/2-oxoacid:ferredoxin oxidoreductase delta subunit